MFDILSLSLFQQHVFLKPRSDRASALVVTFLNWTGTHFQASALEETNKTLVADPAQSKESLACLTL